MALELTDGNFQAEALETDKVVVVDFWAAWCGPCRMIAPVIEELATDNANNAVVGKVDVDHNPNVASQYGVRSIPTILFLKNGVEVDRHVGTASKSQLQKKIDAHA